MKNPQSLKPTRTKKAIKAKPYKYDKSICTDGEMYEFCNMELTNDPLNAYRRERICTSMSKICNEPVKSLVKRDVLGRFVKTKKNK